MISFAIFALTIVTGLLGFLFYIYLTNKTPRTSKIPGPPIADKIEGNLAELREAETLHNYVSELHDEHGPIVAFYLGTQYVVSIGSAELFEQHSQLFDRPKVLFASLEDLISRSSIQFANGEEGKRRHVLYSQYFGATSKFFPEFCQCIHETVEELVKTPKNQFISLQKTMFSLAGSNISRTAFGGVLTKNEMQEIVELYGLWAATIEKSFAGLIDPSYTENQSPIPRIQELAKLALARRESWDDSSEDKRYIDIVLRDPHLTEEGKWADVITMLIGGLHTTANLLTWAVYFLAENPEIQEKLHMEITDSGISDEIIPRDLEKLTFLKQVVNESLRMGCTATVAARYSAEPYTLGGYNIPAGTPVVHALAYVLSDEQYYEEADCFKPEHFSPENVKQRNPFAFKPFGFAGNRICPGNRFAVHESMLALTLLIRSLKFDLVPDQTVEPFFGFITRPREEIWVTAGNWE